MGFHGLGNKGLLFLAKTSLASFSTHFTEKEIEAQKDWGFPQSSEWGGQSKQLLPGPIGKRRGNVGTHECGGVLGGRPFSHLITSSLLKSIFDFLKLLLCTQSLA